MSLSEAKRAALTRLQGALKGALDETKNDPEFIGKVVNTVCNELGLDNMTSMYLAMRFKNYVKERKNDAP